MIETRQRFYTVSITLHWIMFFLLIAVYCCIEFREFYPKGSEPREALKHLHFILGLTVFVLVWVRLFTRLLTYTPKIYPQPSNWQVYLAKAGHTCLYLLMVMMPVAG
jgi:cytochrome b561